MRISLIVAAAENNVIGREGVLPWRLSKDLQHFRELTMGHPVIMGRKTYESIPAAMRPLKGRTNIILSRKPQYTQPGCTIVPTLQEALRTAEVAGTGEAFIIGGEQVFIQAMPVAQRIYLTRVQASVQGDAFFPEIPAAQWSETAREEHPADDKNEYPSAFITYDRKEQ